MANSCKESEEIGFDAEKRNIDGILIQEESQNKLEQSNYENTYGFQTLTPCSNVKLDIYEDALNYVFNEKNIRNIAISGPYSAGKSSVIETYKAKYPNKKFIHLSLASFESKAKKNTEDSNQQEKSNKNEKITNLVLEGKIINQLIHQIPAEDIPRTLFKVKKDVNKKSIKYWSVMSIIFLLLLLQWFFSDNLSYFVSGFDNGYFKSLLQILTSNGWRLISGIALLSILGIFIYQLVKAQTTQSLVKKINVQGSEIEILSDATDSYFDRYLNEVIYLFKKSKADAVVFEDIDRFEKTTIFERLKEINTLLNNHLGVINQKPIKFIYLLRDDLFTSKDRTKFFDYILPVIPIVDSSNSYELLNGMFKNNKPEDKFIRKISLYIDDFRVLKNIYNEYAIYYEKLKDMDLDCNKMLAMIVYKNIFPKDFSLLQLGRGYIYEVLSGKEKMIVKCKDANNNKINEYNVKIENINNEKLQSLVEFDLIEKGYDSSIYSAEYNNEKNELRRRKEVYLKNLNDRKSNVLEGSVNKISFMKREITELEYENSKINSRKIKDILIHSDHDYVFSLQHSNIEQRHYFDENKNDEYFSLLKFLILNGYIDETYSDYMTYFHEGQLSKNDKLFIRKIMERTGADYKYKLKSAEKVFDLIDTNDFSQVEVLNLDLIKYVFSEKIGNSRELIVFINQLEETKNYIFINNFFNDCNDDLIRKTFIKLIAGSWSGVLSGIIDSEIFSREQFCDLSLMFFASCDEKALILANQDSKLSKYISEYDDYLMDSNYNVNKLAYQLSKIGVKFKNIKRNISNSEWISAIYNNSIYSINLDVIYLMYTISNEYHENSISYDYFKVRSYSLLSKNKNSKLYMYLDGNLNMYINVIVEHFLLDKSSKIKDGRKHVIEILNNEKIEMDVRANYSRLIRNKMKDISLVERVDIWKGMFESFTVECNINNLLHYYSNVISSNGLDDILIDYINKVDYIGFSMKSSYNENIIRNFFNHVVENEKINDSSYKMLLSKMGWYYDDGFYKNGISLEKIKILIDINCLRMTLSNIKSIRNNHKYKEKIIPYFIKSKLDEYIDIFNDDENCRNELASLLKCEEIGDAKIKLLKKSKGTYSITGKYLTCEEKRHILENNFDINDIKYLVNNYTAQTEIKETVLSILSYHENLLQENLGSISYKLLEDLAKSNFTYQTKALAFSKIANKLNDKKFRNLIVLLSPTINETISQKNADILIEDNVLTKAILNSFKEKGTIENYQSIDGQLKVQFKQPKD